MTFKRPKFSAAGYLDYTRISHLPEDEGRGRGEQHPVEQRAPPLQDQHDGGRDEAEDGEQSGRVRQIAQRDERSLVQRDEAGFLEADKSDEEADARGDGLPHRGRERVDDQRPNSQ